LECSASAHPHYPAPLSPAMFDFDGDGEPELWAGSSDKFEPDEGALYTFKNNRVERYPLPSVGNRRLQDVDDDGRPDVIWTTVFGEEPDCGDSAGTVQTPGFVAHSLPDGSFSLTDPSARHFAAQWCTAPPERLLDVSDIVCGRLYGLPPAQ